ncbi:MAG: hypothetical protein IPI46_13850 [Bacteroidetes bacterium]|nr:hypothetical protein [Bacteroidota bacterium]
MRFVSIFLLFSLLLENRLDAQTNSNKLSLQDNIFELNIHATNNSYKFNTKPVINNNKKDAKKFICLFGGLNTNGWSVGIGFGKKKNEKITNWFNISLSEIKDDKEERIKPTSYEIQGYGKPRPYIYGKQNYFFPLNIGCSQQRLLLKGLISPSVNVSLVYGINFSLGILKPYYLKLKHSDNGKLHIVDEKYSISNSDTFLNRNNIYSKSNFTNGINESKLIPGINMLCSTQFDIDTFPLIRSIIIGVGVSNFLHKIPLIIEKKRNSTYFNFIFELNLTFSKANH